MAKIKNSPKEQQRAEKRRFENRQKKKKKLLSVDGKNYDLKTWRINTSSII